MLPSFAIEGGLPLALARGVAVAGLFSVFGSVLARAALMRPALAQLGRGRADVERRWRRLVWTSCVVAGVALGTWVWLVAGTLADTPGLAGAAATVPILLHDTAFGHVVLLQVGALVLVALAVAKRLRWLAAVLAATAVAFEAGHGHAAAMHSGPSILLLSVVLHLVAGAAWLGGLLPLLLVVAMAPTGPAALACRRFSPFATACVVTLICTAGFQFWVLIGSLPGLIGTAYGVMALVKILLFAALLGIAARNRFRLTSALSGDTPEAARRRLRRSIAGETMVGLLIVLAAGVLSSLPPAMHDRPVWPFPVRPSLVTVQEDADFRREVIAAGLALGGAIALVAVAALVRHRARWFVLAATIAMAGFAIPHLDLLFVQAYPTSYERSPTGFAVTGIVRGGGLFSENCAACHGATGSGDGPAARGLSLPPTDLTTADLWMHSDGDMFWWLSHGIDSPEDGGLAMPGFAEVLSEDDRWDLIDYVRAHNAGMAMRSTGTWPVPVQAPALQVECGGNPTVTLAALRGKILRLVIGLPRRPPAAQNGVTTIIASPNPTIRSGAAICVTREEDVPRAYAIISGLMPGEISGAQFLIDSDGWLRSLQRPDATAGWDDPGILAQAVAGIRAHPMAGARGGHAHMEM
jgi:putative copper export protein/mono/diheme cytochrome c family protein